VKPQRQRRPPPPPGRPITIRAMLAADCCPELPTSVKHLVHVLALHADNLSGRGLSGQATIAQYMGLSRRQVNRLWAQLEASYAAGGPVGTLRAKRWMTSDAYTLVVRPSAALSLDSRPESRSDIHDKVKVTSAAHEVTPTSNEGYTGVTSTPSESDIRGLQSTEVPLQRGPQSKKPEGFKTSGVAQGANAHAPKSGTSESARRARSAARVAAARAAGMRC
jgi:hypothetical protein